MNGFYDGYFGSAPGGVLVRQAVRRLVPKRRSSAMSGEARWPPEVLRAGGGVGVEVGTAGHVWRSHIHIRMRADWPKQTV